MMRNVKTITLSVDENVLKAVRHYAAERDSSVNKLVREFLADSFGDRLLNLEIGLRFSKVWQQAARRERASRWMLIRFSQEFRG